MSTAAPTGSGDAWEGSGLWTVLYVGSIATMSAVVLTTDASDTRKVLGVGLGLLAIGLHLAWGRALILQRRDGGATAYLLVALCLSFAMFATAPAYFFTLFGVFPLCFTAVERASVQIGAAGLLGAGTAVGIAGWEEWGLHGWTIGLIQGGISFVFATLMGRWIERIIQQSRGRQDLLASLESTRAELAAAHREAGVMAERERLAGEIHDTLAQGFTSILMLVRGATSSLEGDQPKVRALLAAAEQTAQENLDEARSLVAALQPAPLQGSTLADAMRRLGERFAEDTGVPVRVEVIGPPRLLSPAEDVVLLRAAQEALANVRKHARAGSVRLQLVMEDTAVRLVVSDDGAGFDAQQRPGGFGIDTMRARVRQLGGSVDITSRPGQGTQVEVLLP